MVIESPRTYDSRDGRTKNVNDLGALIHGLREIEKHFGAFVNDNESQIID